jgi:hypothetical protein
MVRYSPHSNPCRYGYIVSRIPHTNTDQPGDPEPKAQATANASSSSSSSSSGFGVGLYAVILVGGAIAYGAYNYLQAQQTQQ